MYIYVFSRKYIPTNIHLYLCIFVCMYMYFHTNTYMYECIISVHTCILTQTHASMWCICVYICVPTQQHISTCAYICIAQAQSYCPIISGSFAKNDLQLKASYETYERVHIHTSHRLKADPSIFALHTHKHPHLRVYFLMHTYILTQMHKSKCVYLRVYICSHINTRIYVCIFVCMNIYIHTNTHTSTCVYSCAYTCILT